MCRLSFAKLIVLVPGFRPNILELIRQFTVHKIRVQGRETSQLKTYVSKKCPRMETKEFVDMDVVDTRRQAEGKGAGLSRGIALPEIPKIMV